MTDSTYFVKPTSLRAFIRANQPFADTFPGDLRVSVATRSYRVLIFASS